VEKRKNRRLGTEDLGVGRKGLKREERFTTMWCEIGSKKGKEGLYKKKDGAVEEENGKKAEFCTREKRWESWSC